jgi:hypothetical protein
MGFKPMSDSVRLSGRMAENFSTATAAEVDVDSSSMDLAAMGLQVDLLRTEVNRLRMLQLRSEIERLQVQVAFLQASQQS